LVSWSDVWRPCAAHVHIRHEHQLLLYAKLVVVKMSHFGIEPLHERDARTDAIGG
jgi:hypothetical protein